MHEDTTESLKEAIRVDAGQLRGHIDEAVRTSVEETLNGLLDAEADQICGAQRYQRSADRVDTRAGHYERKLETKSGSVTLQVPKLRSLPFETAIIERYRRREASVEESLVEMYLAGVSVRRVEDITEALWGTRVSSSTVSRCEPEDLQAHRGVAQPRDRGRLSLRVPRWCGAQEKLGGRGP
jgi:transposase-like protein